MKVTFRNKAGLTEYALRCGYVQTIEAHNAAGENVSLELWHEGACFHVRAHNYDNGGRIEWVSEGLLSDARYHFDRLAKSIFIAEKTGQYGPYSVRHEAAPDGENRYFAYHGSEKCGVSDTLIGARIACSEHKRGYAASYTDKTLTRDSFGIVKPVGGAS